MNKETVIAIICILLVVVYFYYSGSAVYATQQNNAGNQNNNGPLNISSQLPISLGKVPVHGIVSSGNVRAFTFPMLGAPDAQPKPPAALTVAEKVDQGIEAHLAIPQGASRGKVANTFFYNGMGYKFSSAGVTPEAYTGGAQNDGSFLDTWAALTVYPVVSWSPAYASHPDNLYDMTDLIAKGGRESFRGHWMFKNQNFFYTVLNEGTAGGIIGGKRIYTLHWGPSPYFTSRDEPISPVISRSSPGVNGTSQDQKSGGGTTQNNVLI
jgi:hypothetical protein